MGDSFHSDLDILPFLEINMSFSLSRLHLSDSHIYPICPITQLPFGSPISLPNYAIELKIAFHFKPVLISNIKSKTFIEIIKILDHYITIKMHVANVKCQ